MGRFVKKHGIIVAGLIIGLLFGVFAFGYMQVGIGSVPQCGVLTFVSEKYDSSFSGTYNESYTVDFHGVNFTFNYWTYPVSYSENGTPIFITDMPHKAYFTIQFSDGVSENLTISVGGYIGVYLVAPLMPIVTDHVLPQAGVATASTTEMHGYWVFLVSLI